MDFSFKNIFSGGLGDSSSGSVVGIDIGSSAIKVVELKKKGSKVMLETYGSVALGPYAGLEIGRLTSLSIEKVSEALKEVLKQAAVSTNSSALAIPVQSSLIFVVELPANVQDTDMGKIVPLEARKYIPVNMSEVSLDYFVLPKREESFEEANSPDIPATAVTKKEVLVVAIQNEAISKYHTIVSQCALQTSFFEIEIFSSVRSCFEHELSLTLLIDFGASRTKLTLVEFGVVKSYHTVNRGGADITDAIARSLSVPFVKAEELKKATGLFENPEEKNVPEVIKVHIDYIFSEINSVLLSHEKKHNQTISKVILTGGGSMMKGLQEMAANNFKAEIGIGRPFGKVGAPEFLGKILDATGPEFAVAIGLALRKLQ
jgi:type IV pilus assembly protein PilM